MKTTTTGDSGRRRCLGGTLRAAVALSALLGLAAAGAPPGRNRPSETDPPPVPVLLKPLEVRIEPWTPVKLAPREVQYLELALAQIHRMEGNFKHIGKQPLGSGALIAAALAMENRPDSPALKADAVRRVTQILDECAGKWKRNECGRSQLPLQRVVLQYPQALPPELLARLRTAVSDAVQPPGDAQIRDSWAFGDTENQRVIAMARSLVAQTVAGTPDSPAARSWGAYAAAFLTAHDRDGWYEAESPGYLALSINGLLQLADHAPQPLVRSLAARQLNVLFAEWAQHQVGGYPAGPKSRTYSFWALSDRGSPWAAWAWLAAGMGKPEEISFMDRPELPVSGYEIPPAVARLLAERRKQPPYEITERRHIVMDKRRDLNTAIYSYATPDYILGAAQAIDGLDLRVSGGQEIAATLYAEGPDFAPVYLWSRTRDPRNEENVGWSTDDQAVAQKNVILARLGKGGADVGHAYLSPAWSRPEGSGDLLVTRSGDTYIALASPGGWDVAPATERFPAYYGGNKNTLRQLAGSWVAVPRRQPAVIALIAGRRAEDGELAAFKQKAGKARLSVVEGEIRFIGSDGRKLDFLPGKRATLAGKAIDPKSGPLLGGPFLTTVAPGSWRFAFGDAKLRLEPLVAAKDVKPQGVVR